MVGVGVGFDVKGAGGIVIQSPVAKGKLFIKFLIHARLG